LEAERLSPLTCEYSRLLLAQAAEDADEGFRDRGIKERKQAP
jgi:hypothetical protein